MCKTISGLPERSNPSCWPPMIANNSDNITTRATKYKAQKHKHRNTMIIKEQNRTYKNTKISSAVQYNENTISEVGVCVRKYTLWRLVNFW